MDQQFCNYSGDQNWKLPASQNSSELQVPDEAEVSGQAKQLSQLDLSSSRERTQSTNDTMKSISMETSKQPTPSIPECYLNNRSEVHENTVEGSENHSEKFICKALINGENMKRVLAYLSKNAPEFLENDDEIFFSRNCFDEEDKENAVKPIKTDNDFLCYQNYLFDDPFSTVPDHGINMTAQNHDLNFGIAQDIGLAIEKEDDLVPQPTFRKSSKPFTILQNVKPPKSNVPRDRKKRGPKPSFSTNPNVKPSQLKIIRSHKKKYPVDLERDMHTDLKRNSEQAIQLQNINSGYDFGDYFRSSTDNNPPYVSDSIQDINEMAEGFWLNPECKEVINTFRIENPGLIDNDMQDRWIQSELIALLGDPSTAIAQPFTPEVHTTKVKKSKAEPEKKLKTINATASSSSQTFASKKSSPLNSSTQMGSENETEDEYSESQNERERRRKPKNIQNKTLNEVINRAVPDEPLQSQPRQAEVEVEASQRQLPLEKTKIRTYFFTVVVNRMFALLRNKELGKEFRDVIKQEAWFKGLVERANWLESVLEAAYQNSEIILEKRGQYQKALQIVEWYKKANQIEDQESQIALAIVRSYEEALQAAQQCQIKMGCKWFQEAMRWKNLQSVICTYKWAQVNKKTLPQDHCNKCCQYYKCDECREFENLCIFLHAIYKKGINEWGQESDEIRSLEKLSEVVGNERFSEADDVIEMNLKEFCQKAASSVMATFLKEGEEFYEISIQVLYDPGRNSKKQPVEAKIIDDDEKRRLYLRYKSDIRKRFATPKDYPKISAKK